MASFIVNEMKVFNDNVFKYEEKLSSPLNRFLDKSPTFVTYFHINNQETTADQGFQDTEEILGPRSSLRFGRIDNFPIYGLEQIQVQLSDEDQGIDGSYEGDGTILPNTIKPLPNDYFVINHLNDFFLFRVTGIAYDSIRPEGYYGIQFKLESTDASCVTKLKNQTTDKYRCIFKNIGTENKAIIREDDFDKITEINKMYEEIVNLYISIYYNEKYNAIMGTFKNDGTVLYDPLMSVFIDKNGILNDKNNYSSIVLGEQFTDPKREFKYENSIYRFFERKDPTKIEKFAYQLIPGRNYFESAFYKWYDDTVMVVDRPDVVCENNPENCLLCDDFIDAVAINIPNEESEYSKFLIKYLRGEIKSLADIPLNLKDVMLHLNISKESFFFTPIVLYVIKRTTEEFITVRDTL